MEEAVGRLVAILRKERPQVVITYNEDQQGYPHPDHIRVHDITRPAVDAAADPAAYPGTGSPWQVSKIYYTGWSRQRIVQTHEKMLELGLESPYNQEWLDRFNQDHRITTQVDVREWFDVREQALRAHATQVDPDSAFWFALPNEVAAEVYPYDDYILARSTVDVELPETDLFAGLR
jgi:mycothiol S-conjugate amidase